MTCRKCGRGGRRLVAIVAGSSSERPGLRVEPLRLSKARGPPVQLELPPRSEFEGIDPVYPE